MPVIQICFLSTRIQMPVIFSFFITRDLYTLGVRSALIVRSALKLIVTWLVPDHAIKGKSQKRIETVIRVEKKKFLLKTTRPFSKSFFFLFFWKETGFCSFVKKISTKIPFSIICIASCNMTIFKKLHNKNLLYLLCHSNLRIKNVPHHCFC